MITTSSWGESCIAGYDQAGFLECNHLVSSLNHRSEYHFAVVIRQRPPSTLQPTFNIDSRRIADNGSQGIEISGGSNPLRLLNTSDTLLQGHHMEILMGKYCHYSNSSFGHGFLCNLQKKADLLDYLSQAVCEVPAFQPITF